VGNTSNGIFKELEKAINEEIKARKLDVTVEVRGFDKGFLTHLSRTSLNIEEKKKLNEAMNTAWEKLRKKWFKEFYG
jgi:hypothetical protein